MNAEREWISGMKLNGKVDEELAPGWSRSGVVADAKIFFVAGRNRFRVAGASRLFLEPRSMGLDDVEKN